MSDTAAQHKRPLWLAALLTSIGAPLVYYIGALAVNVVTGGSFYSEEAFRALGFVMLIGLPASVAAMFILGMPFVLLLRAIGKLSALNVSLGAAAIGAVTFSMLIRVSGGTPEMLPEIGIGAFIGLLTGAIFSTIAGLRFRLSHP